MSVCMCVKSNYPFPRSFWFLTDVDDSFACVHSHRYYAKQQQTTTTTIIIMIITTLNMDFFSHSFIHPKCELSEQIDDDEWMDGCCCPDTMV